MKYYRNFFIQSKINNKTPVSRTSLFFCYIIIIRYFIISYMKQFICRHKKIFVKMDFYYLFNHLFKNCFNESINCIFSSLKNNWLAKYIINTHNFIIKTVRNMIFIFFSVWSIIISITTFDPF